MSATTGSPGDAAPPEGLPALLKEDLAHCRRENGYHSVWRALFDPGFLILLDYRFGHWARGLRTPALGLLMRILYRIANFLTFWMTGVNIQPGAIIGRHFSVHSFQGIAIANGAVIGDRCTINSFVSIIHKANYRGEGVARIGNDVYLGMGAKILGGVTIGDGAIIGVNAVVTRSIPERQMVMCAPVVVVPRPGWLKRKPE